MKPYRAEMGPPPMPDEGAPGPLTEKQRMGKMVVGSDKDRLSAEDRRKLNPVLEPVPGEKKPKKYAAGGSASSRADGCVTKGKTKGRML